MNKENLLNAVRTDCQNSELSTPELIHKAQRRLPCLEISDADELLLEEAVHRLELYHDRFVISTIFLSAFLTVLLIVILVNSQN